MNSFISGIVLISLLAPIALPVAPAVRDSVSEPYSVGDKIIPLTDADVAVSYFRDLNGNATIDREDEGIITPLSGNSFYDGIDDLTALLELLDGKFAGEE